MERKTMERSNSIAPSSALGINCFFLGEEAVLFSEVTQRLYRLNTTAAFIWCCCEEQLTFEAIIQSLADVFRIPVTLARRDATAVLVEWKSLGLLAGDMDQIVVPAPKGESHSAPVELPFPVSMQRNWSERRYRLIDVCFRIRFNLIDAERLVHPIVVHLEVPIDTPFDVTLDVIGEGGMYHLLKDTIPIASCATSVELGPLVHAYVLLTAYEATDCLIAIHGAAVSDGKSCILFPAGSGSGKSTLTAALLSSEFMYLTDDLALLTQSTCGIRPVPVSIGLKQGSWSVLTPLYPVINTLPVHLRSDGKTVRYLLPPRSAVHCNPEQTYPVRCIVFPNYRAGDQTTIAPLSPAEALCRLTKAGYDMNGGLDAARVGELVEWIAGLDCYELQFDDLPQAISKIRELLK